MRAILKQIADGLRAFYRVMFALDEWDKYCIEQAKKKAAKAAKETKNGDIS